MANQTANQFKKFSGLEYELLNDGLSNKPNIENEKWLHRDTHTNFRIVHLAYGWAVYGLPKVSN